LPGELDVTAPGEEQHDVERPLAEDLVSDADLAVAGVVGLGRHRRRIGGSPSENQAMPRKRKKKLRPKLPSRVKKTRTKRGARARRQHPELWGLGTIALGLFLGAVLYFGWNGGYVGGWLGDGLDRLVGDAKYVVAVAFAAVGALGVTRSAVV